MSVRSSIGNHVVIEKRDKFQVELIAKRATRAYFHHVQLTINWLNESSDLVPQIFNEDISCKS